ncbi:MAG: hypothetical protein HQM13_23175 [SAR324 cluster bacterium]|nr:hypothetical protein [SAR324 cluster bacterium]
MPALCLLTVLILLMPFHSVAQSSLPSDVDDIIRAAKSADLRIKRFQEALKSGSSKKIREAALGVRQDPLAVSRINKNKGDLLKQQLQKELTGIQTEAKHLMRQNLADQINADPVLKKKLGYGKNTKVSINDVDFFEATGKKKGIKVGQDWDVTVRVKGKDAPIELSEKIAKESFYEAARGKKPKNLKQAVSFADKHHVEVTHALHPEAYGRSIKDADIFFKGSPGTMIKDIEQISKAMKYKSDIAAQKAKNLLENAQNRVDDLIKQGKLKKGSQEALEILSKARSKATVWKIEQARQYVKQYKLYVAPRVQAMGQKIPDAVAKGSSILEKIANGALTPDEGMNLLRKQGQSIESIIDKGTGSLEAMQKHVLAKNAVFAKKGILKNVIGNDGVERLVKLGKGLGLALALTEVGGTLSVGYQSQRMNAARDDREFGNVDHVHAFMKATEDAIILPARFLKGFVSNSVANMKEHSSKIIYQEMKKSNWSSQGIINALERLDKDARMKFMDITLRVYDGGTDLMSNAYQKARQDPRNISYFIGDLLMANALLKNSFYDSQADRQAFNAIRLFARQMIKEIDRRMGRVLELQMNFRRLLETGTASDANKAELAKMVSEYSKIRSQLSRFKGRWDNFKGDKFGGEETDPLIVQFNALLNPRFSQIAMLPDNLVPNLENLPLELYATINTGNKQSFLGENLEFEVNMDGGKPPYAVLWTSSQGDSQRATTNNRNHKTMLRFTSEGNHWVKAFVQDSSQPERQESEDQRQFEIRGLPVVLYGPGSISVPGAEAAFRAEVKRKPDGSPFGFPPYSYFWTMDGQPIIEANIAREGKGSESHRTIIPNEIGDYHYKVEVRDSAGALGLASHTISLQGMPLELIVSTEKEGRLFPVPGAQVTMTLEGSSNIQHTDSYGRVVSAVFPGKSIPIQVEKEGYETEIRTVTYTSTDQGMLSLSIQLKTAVNQAGQEIKKESSFNTETYVLCFQQRDGQGHYLCMVPTNSESACKGFGQLLETFYEGDSTANGKRCIKTCKHVASKMSWLICHNP